MRIDNPYAYQRHIYDKTRPENLAFLRRLRAPAAALPRRFVGGRDRLRRIPAHHGRLHQWRRHLHMAYSFDLLTEQCSPAYIRRTVEGIERELADGWSCWSMGNHDVVRVMTRWHLDGRPGSGARPRADMLLLSLRGSVCLYQGGEQ